MFHRYRTALSTFAFSLAPTTTVDSDQEAGEQDGVAWWVWVLTAIVLLGPLLWWWLRSRRAEEGIQGDSVEALVAAPSPEASTPVPTPAPTTPDDLKRIEGIGPKISSVLQAADIVTFARLSVTDVSRLKQILAEAGLTALADPTTWPEQAGLAAAGRWEELDALQDELKGGRRV